MASAAYWTWVRAGRPYTLMTPARALQRNIRRHGIVVYDYPDDSHLEASTPQDHTPFSATEWPIQVSAYIGRGLDIMYRTAREGDTIARRLIADRDAGHPGVKWIKYINWTDVNGVCRQERWTDPANPNKRTTRSSTDKGHIHVSGRSDMDNYTGAELYDPLAAGGVPMGTAEQISNADTYGWKGWTLTHPITGIKDPSGNPVAVPNEVALSLRRIETTLAEIAKRVDLDPAEVDRLVAATEAAAQRGAAAALVDPAAIELLATELARVSDKDAIRIALTEFFTKGIDGSSTPA